uniref:ATP synthase complex subunit 8 n=1 Tax=Xyrias revulsus TaxID=189512 RepID=A0A678QSN9_9TELE|nr:ATP synthase subunit F0 8 [Xyrias revulsus]
MPQLNPDPWLMSLLLAWTFFVAMLPPKVLGFFSNNKPKPTKTKKSKPKSWPWPWS